MVRWVLRSTEPKPKNVTTYIIMTTTDCNARCFYCFEKGRSRIPMGEETAHKTARYIREHCGGQRVRILWFGGEPLFNQKVMDIISQDLREAGIAFHSGIATNGYLFDAEAVHKAKNLWNLDMAQITLDGTEAVYNRSKAFIYRDGKIAIGDYHTDEEWEPRFEAMGRLNCKIEGYGLQRAKCTYFRTFCFVRFQRFRMVGIDWLFGLLAPKRTGQLV